MKKILWLSILFSIMMFAGCAEESAVDNADLPDAGKPALAVQKSNPVRLFYSKAQSERSGYSYFASYWVAGTVDIENIAYKKDVVVIYRTKSTSQASFSGAWASVAAVYVKGLSNNRELWSFTLPSASAHLSSGGINFEYAISYKVNGVEYWDNNQGRNYVDGCLGKSIVVLQSAYAYYAWPANQLTLSGDVLLKNLAYDKKVQVLYTQDDWKTSKTADAKYVYGDAALETWRFSELLSNSNPVKFAVSYTVNGYTAWDNNFNSNYDVVIPELL